MLLGRGHLGPHREKGGTGNHLGGIHRRFSPLTLPTSKKASYNIWPSVEPRKTQLFHDSWSPFWHLFLADSTPGGAWGSPWEHPGSTFASRPQKTSKIFFWEPPFRRYSEHIFHVFLMCFSSEFFYGLWTTFS